MRTRVLFSLLIVAAGPCDSYATQVTGADILAKWQQTRIERLGSDQASLAGMDLTRQMLVDPSSAYSDVTAQPDFTNQVDWPTTLDAFPQASLTSEQALDALRRELGMTRARPYVDITPGSGFRDDFVAASATKADIDADIFWHMLDLTGFRHSTKAAVYALGMQILRSQVLATPSAQWIASGIDPAVFTRVMQAQHMGQLREYDLDYLSTIVQYRLVHRRAGGPATTGQGRIPELYRVARIAAAYRDAQGYIGSAPCLGDGSPHPRAAGTGNHGDDRPLCFAAATDRAVHAWYVGEYRRQATQVPDHHDHGLRRLTHIAGLVLALIDLAGVLEFVDAAIADDLATSEAIGTAEAEAASAPADLLSCRIPE